MRYEIQARKRLDPKHYRNSQFTDWYPHSSIGNTTPESALAFWRKQDPRETEDGFPYVKEYRAVIVLDL